MAPSLLAMIALRLLSGTMEISAAILIYRLNNLEQALKINAILASIGPFVFLTAMYLGLSGLSSKIPYSKLFFIYLGVLLIFWGLRS
ncbi:MAG: YqhV family protein [Dethiobacteria bacterium]|jgi:hypothetical protein|nr:YqhV family protein [Bacillota bacterium]